VERDSASFRAATSLAAPIHSMISPSWPSIGRRAFALPGTQPVVPLEAHGLAQDGHELVLDEPIDLGAVLLIEMVMTDDGEHGTF